MTLPAACATMFLIYVKALRWIIIWRTAMNTDEIYMREALRQAKKAYGKMETPIGCVIVREGKTIARGYNKRNDKKNTLAHAEIIAIHKAGRAVGDWRLEDCTMYVTLEPCPMCAGAIVQAFRRRRRCVLDVRRKGQVARLRRVRAHACRKDVRSALGSGRTQHLPYPRTE